MFRVKNSNFSRRIIVIFVCATILILSDYRYHLGSIIKYYTDYITYPLVYLVDLPFKLYNNSTTKFFSQKKLLQENQLLKTKIAMLESDIRFMNSSLDENKVLRDLLSSSAKIKSDFTLADILAVSNNYSKNIVIIDKGQADDVFYGQAVIDAYGIYGNVIEVGKLTSKVLLITDERNSISVQDKSGNRAIANGLEGASMELLDITETTKFRIGDILYSSGLGLRYPKGYPVGKILSITRESGEIFSVVKIVPAAHVSSSRKLILVWPEKNMILEEAKLKLKSES